jgi:PhnB protein
MAKKSKAKAKTSPKKSPKKTSKAKARKPAKKKVAAIPAGYHTVTPYLVCRGAADAIAFYKKAFGAKERVRMAGPDGRVMHAELLIGNSMLMLGDEAPEQGATSPQQIGGTAVHVFLYVPNIDKAFAQAAAAGATVEMPPTDMFWGDRYGKLADPFGHKWAMGTHIEDVSAKETARRAAAFAQQQGQGPA